MMRNVLITALILAAVAIPHLTQSANAAAVSHLCSPSHGFDPHPDDEYTVGFITYMKIGNVELGTDLSVSDPMRAPGSDNLNVFGVVTNIYWGGGWVDPILINARVSEGNKDLIQDLLMTGLPDTDVEFAFDIYDSDDYHNQYYNCFSTNWETLDGLIAKEGGDLRLNISQEPAFDVMNPENYEFFIEIMPDEFNQQDLLVATSLYNTSIKPWGVDYVPDPPDPPDPPLPEPSTFTLTAIGLIGLAMHAWRRKRIAC